MPTINEVIERVERVKPMVNVEDQDKAKWLIDLDGRIYNELTGRTDPDTLPPRSWPEDGDKPLLVGAPYDRLYDLWIISMMEFYMREYTDYNNTAMMFNEAYQEFATWHRQNNAPPSSHYSNLFG